MTTDRLVCVKGGECLYQLRRTQQIGSSNQRRRTKTFMNLFWCGREDFQHFSGFSTTVTAFLNSQAKLQSRSDSMLHFLQMAHKNSLFGHLQRNKLFFLCVCWFVYLFLYFVVVIFFLLNTAAWAPPCRKAQYGSVCKSESGGHKTENRGEQPGEI